MDFKNAIMLMDTITGDGIEAWVALDEQDMPVLNVIKTFSHVLLTTNMGVLYSCLVD